MNSKITSICMQVSSSQCFGWTLQVLSTVEETYGQVDETKQASDKLEWDMRNEQRRLAAESQSTTPAKGAAQQPAAARLSLAAASRLLQDMPAAQAQQRSQRQTRHRSAPSPDIIELD